MKEIMTAIMINTNNNKNANKNDMDYPNIEKCGDSGIPNKKLFQTTLKMGIFDFFYKLF